MPFYRKKKPVGATDHLEEVGLLLDDVAKRNAWRAAHPELRYVGLAGAKLRRADLAGANLRGAILREADLYRADREGADLSLADLKEANLGVPREFVRGESPTRRSPQRKRTPGSTGSGQSPVCCPPCL
jgi:hypothetical protein